MKLTADQQYEAEHLANSISFDIQVRLNNQQFDIDVAHNTELINKFKHEVYKNIIHKLSDTLEIDIIIIQKNIDINHTVFGVREWDGWVR